MSKKDSSSDTESGNDVVIVDTEDAVVVDAENEVVVDTDDAVVVDTEDAVEFSPDSQALSENVDEPESHTESPSEAESPRESDSPPVTKAASSTETEASTPGKTPPSKPRRSWFGLFNFLLIVALAAAAGYYWWQQQQISRERDAAFARLEQALATKASNSALETGLQPLDGKLGSLQQKLDALESGQQDLRDSSEKLYELYGRDKNDWQLAEVEYLMRVAQHKLFLQDDFEGAAITLQAASDKMALTGDPGLLSVRVKISEEIADLKTRKRPDLVGMTLILAQLGRQIRMLEPGFALRIDDSEAPPATAEAETTDWLARLETFVDSLVTIRYENGEPSQTEANTIDVSETLEDNLKLARWAVLERDARQYRQLIEQSLRLFREFYDLDNAAHADFLQQLQDLQKMELEPAKPNIEGSLRELQRILSQRQNAPAESAPVTTEESGNG